MGSCAPVRAGGRVAPASMACARPVSKALETLAAEMAQMLASEFPALRAEVEVRKFILPNTEYVAVRYEYKPAP